MFCDKLRFFKSNCCLVTKNRVKKCFNQQILNIKDIFNNIVFVKAKTKDQGDYHTRNFDNKVNLSVKQLVLLMPCGYRFNRAVLNFFNVF